MGSFIDRTGQRYGFLTVMALAEKSRGQQTRWICRCDCGTIKTIRSGDLTTGKTLSCGCYHKKIVTKHGLVSHGQTHPLYPTWISMISRCENPRDKDYSNYGGRGISVCEEWHNAKNFVSDMYPTWKPGLQLDRIDNNSGYSPKNCHWVTARENLNNKRNTVYARGMPVSFLSEKSGINAATLKKRIRDGWSEDELLRPVSNRPRDSILEKRKIMGIQQRNRGIKGIGG